ncbi:MAG TPA: PQQ-binding-like beta-propeller repeat protein [Polyangiaceae bacterium]|nr:PQQ-binding-like beta-propeller repeat protein [Polyangiaceae bacterium]
MKQLTRRIVTTCCISILGAASLGCEALRGGAQPEHPTWFERPSQSLHVTYRTSLAAQSRRRGEAYERGRVEVDPIQRRLFVGSSDRGLYCVDARDGSPLWRFEAAGRVQSAPLYDANEQSVYFGSDDGALYKLDATNGDLRYRFATNAEISERPVLVGDRLYLVNANDSLLSLDAKTGKMLWHQHRAPVPGMQIGGHAGLLVASNRVYAGFSDGVVIAYDAISGVERWPPVDLAAEGESVHVGSNEHFDVDTTPVADTIDGNPVLYVASAEAGLFALDAEGGTQIWQNDAVVGATQLLLWSEPQRRQSSNPAPADEGQPPVARTRKLLIVATGTSGLWAIEPNDGSVVWRSRLPDGGVQGPVPFAGALLVSASQLGLYLVSPLNGRVIDGMHIVEGVSALPTAYGTHAFVMTNTGDLLALHAAPPREPPDRGVLLLDRPYERSHW